MAHLACILLRKQLAQQEMERRFTSEQTEIRFDHNTGQVYHLPKEEFIFSTREQYSKFRGFKMIDDLASKYLPAPIT